MHIEDPEVLCKAPLEACVCDKPVHDRFEPHVCGCGGSWNYIRGKFICYKLPGYVSVPEQDLILMLYNAFSLDLDS